MKRENSIKLLKEQKNKLQDKTLDELHWTDETANLVSNIFGKDSEQYKQIRDISIRIDNNTYYGEEFNPMKNRIRAEKYLDSFITQVQNFTYDNQVSFNKEKEFKFSKSTIYTLTPIIISGAFALGLYFGNTKFDKDKIELTDQVKSLSADTLNFAIKLKLKDSVINKKDILLKTTVDSLRTTQKDMNSLYLYIGALEKTK